MISRVFLNIYHSIPSWKVRLKLCLDWAERVRMIDPGAFLGHEAGGMMFWNRNKKVCGVKGRAARDRAK